MAPQTIEVTIKGVPDSEPKRFDEAGSIGRAAKASMTKRISNEEED